MGIGEVAVLPCGAPRFERIVARIIHMIDRFPCTLAYRNHREIGEEAEHLLAAQKSQVDLIGIDVNRAAARA